MKRADSFLYVGRGGGDIDVGLGLWIRSLWDVFPV